ncbi:hypothetical protein M569_11151 [Genlisea aurea]|uniref:RNA polymerase subunit H/Rpb5 C-terminal domain-containing protein n=1 Tax=Genlisea aurea TaxID=192259 RepID=S8C9M2_9LAMI|nr:hypothetical protein M569_11151 [Genlisea aurea]
MKVEEAAIDETLEDDENLGTCLSSFVDKGSLESHRYYLARKTLLEMLKDRGFAISPADIDITLQEFRIRHSESPSVDGLKITALHGDDPSIKVLVLFCGPGIVKVNQIRAIAGDVYNNGTISSLILVAQSKITSQALKAVNILKFKVEIFQITDLLVNITKHDLKPKHQILSAEEKADLLSKYSIEEKQASKSKKASEAFLPRMLQKDAIARYYGLEKGQVVKVTYGGELTQLHVTYRCVW